MREDKHMMTAEELRLRAQRRRRLVLALSLLLVVGFGGYFAGPPTLNAIKGWQARRHAKRAFALIDQGDWNNARKEAVAAYQLRPTEPQALRAVARFLSRTRQPQAFELWDLLAAKQTLTPEDRRDEAGVALANGELDRAATAVDQLLANNGKQVGPGDWILEMQLRLQQGVPDKAMNSLDHVLENPLAKPRDKFQATLLQLQAARTGKAEFDLKNQRDAWTRLNQFAQSDDAVGLDSLVLLAQRQLAVQSERSTSADSGEPLVDSGASLATSNFDELLSREELVRRLQSHPLAKVPQKLLATDLQIQAEPTKRDALIAKAIADWKNTDVAQLATLATWLNGKGFYQGELDTIPQERAIQSRELFLQRLDALGALGRWEEVRQLLDAERFPLDPVVQLMYLARCNAQLQREAASKNNWQRALEAAAGDVGKLMTLAEYAEKNAAIDVAGSAYEQATVVAPNLRVAWQGKLRAIYASHDTPRIHAVLVEMLNLWPNDSSIQNDEAYIALLLFPPGARTGELDRIATIAERLIGKEPLSLPHRTLLALVWLRKGEPDQAMQIYKDILIPPHVASLSALVVSAAVLAAQGEIERARERVAGIPIAGLLPEERALLPGE